MNPWVYLVLICLRWSGYYAGLGKKRKDHWLHVRVEDEIARKEHLIREFIALAGITFQMIEVSASI